MIRNHKYKFSSIRQVASQIFCAVGLFSGVSLLSGCVGDDQIPMLTIDSVSLYADLDANLNSAIPVDMVLVYSTEVNKMISTLSASKYYQNSQQLQRDNPTALDIWHWELVPGQSVENFEINQSKGDAFDGYIFANYLTPGDHRIKISPSGVVKVLMLKEDMMDLTKLNVQNVTSGITAPAPQNQPTKTSEATQTAKTQQVGRSTSEFKEFDTRPKGSPPEMTPPYLFEVPGTVNTGQTGPIDLRPDDSKKGLGDTALLGQEIKSTTSASQTSTSSEPGDSSKKPCTDSDSTTADGSQEPEGVVWETMPYHGPDTTAHTHHHPHDITKVEPNGSTTTHQIIHSHEHGHPHPLVGGEDGNFDAIQLAPPPGVGH